MSERKPFWQDMWETAKLGFGLGLLGSFCAGVVLFTDWLIKQL
jgi:hypothetical protein